jgi:hypothetical protein
MVTYYSPTSEMHFHYMTNNDKKYTLFEYLNSLSNIAGILPMGIKLKITHHS